MKKLNWKIAVGIGLLLLGGLALVTNLGLMPVSGSLWEILAGGVFAVAGLVFLAALLGDREAWWAAFPGFTLPGIGALIILGSLAPRIGGSLGGALVLGSISLAFWVVFLLRRGYWWALIPAGILLSLAAITVIPGGGRDGMLIPGVLFLGMAATFLLLVVLPPADDRQRWAWIPAAILGFMGVSFLFFSSLSALNLVLPPALILGGAYLIFRSVKR